MGGRIDAPHQVEKCGLAATRWSRDGQEHAVLDIEVDVAQGAHRLLTQRVFFGDILDSYDHHQRFDVSNALTHCKITPPVLELKPTSRRRCVDHCPISSLAAMA